MCGVLREEYRINFLWRGMSSGFRWRRWSLVMGISCEYIEKVAIDSRQKVVLQLVVWAGS
jgi:hypothetical protein